MRPSPIASLLLSSILLLFIFSGCRTVRYKSAAEQNFSAFTSKEIMPVLPENGKAIKFNASIDILKNHLTGLLIVKKTDPVTSHMVFVTELGMKMFDFKLSGSELTADYVFEPLNKPALIEVLKKNFKNMLLLDIYEKPGSLCITKNKNHYYSISEEKENRYFTVSDTNKLLIQDVTHKKKLVSRIKYQYATQTRAYTRITCKQYGLVKFYFELNAIPPAND